MKKILLLGGSAQQIVAIKTAQKLGYYTVLCDYLPDNPGQYEADKFYIVPAMSDPKYLDIILDICKKEKIDAVFTLIDPEISLIAKNKTRFLDIGTIPLVSDYEKVELAFDKFKMYTFLKENGFKTAKSYIDKNKFYQDLNKGNIKFPVFIKPVKGSASINISKVNSKEEVDLLFSLYDNLIIQEFLDGQEIGADVYIDPISKKVVSIFTKEKIKMRAGETDKSRSFKDEKLFKLITELVEKIGYVYMIDMDLFRINGEYYISEINPRFGGGYPHAYESGVDFPKLIINTLNNQENINQVGIYKENI